MGCWALQELVATGKYTYRLGAFPSWGPHNQPLSREDYIRSNMRCTVPTTRNALCYFQRNFLKYLPSGLVLPPQMSKMTVVSSCISHLPPEHLNTSPASPQMTCCLNPYLDYLLWLNGYVPRLNTALKMQFGGTVQWLFSQITFQQRSSSEKIFCDQQIEDNL